MTEMAFDARVACLEKIDELEALMADMGVQPAEGDFVLVPLSVFSFLLLEYGKLAVPQGYA